MSSWKFQVFVDVTKLESLISHASNVQGILNKVGAEVAKDVRANIQQKNIIDTGALLGSITYELQGDNDVVVRDGVSYGVYNEFGTYKMAARPFFVPAVEKAGEIFTGGFMELLR